jgi:hypothetical protein
MARQRDTTNGIFAGDRKPADSGIPGNCRAADGNSPQRKPSDGECSKRQAAKWEEPERSAADGKAANGNAAESEEHAKRHISDGDPSRRDAAPITAIDDATGGDMQ